MPLPSSVSPPAPEPARASSDRLELAACWVVLALLLTLVAAWGAVRVRVELAVPPLVAAGLVWWRASVLASRARPAAKWIVAGAVVLRIAVLAGDLELSDDSRRYVWEAEVLARGTSPYAFAPSSPELAELRLELPGLYRSLNHPEVSAAYPPLYQAASAAVVGLARLGGAEGGEHVPRALFGLRLFTATCDLLVLLPLFALLRSLGRPPAAAVTWGWSPLVAIEFAGSGHMDAFGILLWMAALAVLAPLALDGRAGWKARRAVAGELLLAGAILVKYLPALCLPYVLRGPGRRSWTGLALVIALVAAGFAPILWLSGGAGGLLAGLSEYGLRWESTSLLYRFVEAPLAAIAPRDGSLLDPRRLGRGLVLVVWLATAAALWRRRADALRASWLLLGLYLALSPTLHPWYLTWAVPFLALYPCAAWGWLVSVAPLCYWILGAWRAEGVWREPAWLWPVTALPFFALLALRRRGGRA